MNAVWRVVADLGNSALKIFATPESAAAEWIAKDWDTANKQAFIFSQPISLRESDWPENIPNALRVFDDLAETPAQWTVASVNRPAFDQLKSWLHRHRAKDRLNLVTWRDIPLKLDVEHPQCVGIDRLVAGWAARSFAISSARINAQVPPVVVVDAGSAMTVDLVDSSGVFRGGAIYPGLRLQILSLSHGTDALTEIELGPPLNERLVAGRNTEQAIRLGVSAAAAGGIRLLFGAYQIQLSRTPRLILTGGDATYLSPHLPNAEVVPNLILGGLLRLSPQTIAACKEAVQ